MTNPFIQNNYVLPTVSVNKLIINERYSLEDEIVGKKASDIFSTRILIEEIKKYATLLYLNISEIDELMYPNFLEQALSSKQLEVKKAAETIMEKMGRRLGIILLTLIRGDEVNRLTRKEWTSSHWDYWKSVKKVYLVGGLTSGLLGKHLKKNCLDFLKLHHVHCQIIISPYAQIAGIVGCSTLLNVKDGQYLIFDFGQSFIKRSIIEIKDYKLTHIYSLKNIPSLFVETQYQNQADELLDATSLHQYIIDTIKKTIQDCVNFQISNKIIISIANYIMDGYLCQRGGYGKLRHLSSNYETYLNQELNHQYELKLVHDGTASSLIFSEPNSLCLSLGTAFGVGFPSKKNKTNISKTLTIVEI